MGYCYDVNFYIHKWVNDTVLEKADFEAIDRDAVFDVCEKCSNSKIGSRWVIKYIGKNDMSFTNGKVYTLRRLKEEKYGKDNVVVYDNNKDWFRTSNEYIQENFQIIEIRTNLGYSCYATSITPENDYISNIPLDNIYDGDVDTLKGIHEQDKFYFSQSIQDLVDIIEDGYWVDEFPSVLITLREKDPDTCMKMCKYILENKAGDDFAQSCTIDEIQGMVYSKYEDCTDEELYKVYEDELWLYCEKFLNKNSEVKKIFLPKNTD